MVRLSPRSPEGGAHLLRFRDEGVKLREVEWLAQVTQQNPQAVESHLCPLLCASAWPSSFLGTVLGLSTFQHPMSATPNRALRTPAGSFRVAASPQTCVCLRVLGKLQVVRLPGLHLDAAKAGAEGAWPVPLLPCLHLGRHPPGPLGPLRPGAGSSVSTSPSRLTLGQKHLTRGSPSRSGRRHPGTWAASRQPPPALLHPDLFLECFLGRQQRQKV